MKRTLLGLLKWIRNLRPLVYILLCAFLMVLVCFLFKYTFVNSCIGQVCPNKDADISGPIFGVGGIFFTAIALIPAFWVDSKLKDAKDEMRRQVIEDVRKEVVDLAEAQMLLFKAHYDSEPGQLLAGEEYIQKAVLLYPDAKKQEYPDLGKRFARTALGLSAGDLSSRLDLPSYDWEAGRVTLSDTWCPIDLGAAVNRAILYLEESRTYPENVDRDLLFNLACMYGFYPLRYEEMIRCMQSAIHLDDYVKKDFASYQALTMLSRACNRDYHKMKSIGETIELELPMTKDSFLKEIQAIDDDKHNNLIQGYGILKNPVLQNSDFYFIKISLTEINGKCEATAGIFYQEPGYSPGDFFEGKKPPISLEDLYDCISNRFHLIALKNK